MYKVIEMIKQNSLNYLPIFHKNITLIKKINGGQSLIFVRLNHAKLM